MTPLSLSNRRGLLQTVGRGLMGLPGVAGLFAGAAAHSAADGKPENADGSSIIANNIFTGFGYGDAHWILGDERSPFKFDARQETDVPPLTDVMVQGNLVPCAGQPRYKFAVIISTEQGARRRQHFSNNLFAPRTAGVANQELP